MAFSSCLFCDRVLELKTARDLSGRKKFCSHACRQRWRYANGEWDMSKLIRTGKRDYHPPNITRVCEICGELYRINGNKQRFCKKCVPDRAARSNAIRYGISSEQLS